MHSDRGERKMKTRMKRHIKRILAIALVFSILSGMLPMARLTAFATGPDTYTLSNGYISVTVSAKNGGFTVDTDQGSRLVKSDNNKKLLYHSGEYDTSFTSFQVDYPGGQAKEYVFGGNYSFLGLGGNNLTTVQDATGITSTWTVDRLTFTQRIELANSGSAEHGMVALTYKVSSQRSDTVSVKQRLLLDTALGDQDFAYYAVTDGSNNSRRVQTEQIIETKDHIPLGFFAYDDPNAPGITAYSVNSSNSMPYRLAFAHWNNLAATAFDFVPDPAMNFTNKDNLKYQTADSAYALYYDMGSVAPGGSGKQVSTDYGVYSNEEAEQAGSIAVNAVSPLSLELSEDGKSYKKTGAALPGQATFSIQAQLDNYASDRAKDYDKVTVAFYTYSGITPLDGAGGEVLPAPTYQTPFTADFMDFSIGEMKTSTFYFKVDVGASSAYRKVEMNVFDTSKDVSGTESNLVRENLIGTYTFYVLCPGGDGELPKVTFMGSEPEILYYEGTRHLYITGGNLQMLNGDKSQYTLYAHNTADAGLIYRIPSDNILFPQENLMDIAFTEEMAPGSYELRFELTYDFAEAIGSSKILTAPALSVVMSDDLQFRNTYYGIVAVVQEGSGPASGYLIKSYKNEGAFDQDKANYDEILVTLRGDFTVEDDGYGGDKYTATSVYSTDNNGGKNAQNLITINNCIDFEGGNISVYYKYESGTPQSVYVDFDGSLYTSVERTGIWKGKAAFTEIKNGLDYGLTPYNKGGTKLQGFNGNPIMLIWPNALGLGQTLAGMVVKFTYGTLGVMYDSDAANITGISSSTPVAGNVLSFSGALDLGFLIPQSRTARESSRNINAGTELYWISQDPKDELRGLWDHYYEQTQKNKTQTGKEYTPGQASIYVDNILFGCGKGFIGVKFTTDLALPAYIDAMPSIQGKLTVNTINDWAMAVKGTCQFTTITLEVELGIRSHNNIPVPDKLYFYVAGFEPGINVDGFGVLWITGGGGGIDKLYDTVFASNGIPPLKLLISVAFDVFKILSARADLSLSLRGIGLNVNGVKLKGSNIELLKRMQLQFDWYPDIYFLAAVSASFYDIVIGQGYIVIIDNEKYHGFFEGFVRGVIRIPGSIPIIGGINIAQVDFGINNDKLWGAAWVFGAIGISVVYYWGGDVDVYLKKNPAAQPTFPELLGYEDIPVYYDKEKDRTLYMRIGDNLTLASMAEITGDTGKTPRLFGAGPTVYSDAAREKHVVNTGAYAGKKYVYTASFHATSLEDARSKAAGFGIYKKDHPGQVFPLEMYDPDSDNLPTANANLTYDAGTQTAALGVALTRSEDFDTEWEILTTGVPADIVLFEVGSIPEMTSANGAISGRDLSVTWDGTDLDKLDSVSFYLTEDATGAEPGELIATLDERDDITRKNGSFALPADLPSGDYYLRAVYSQEDVVNGIRMGNSISYTNSNQPDDPGGVTIANGGDLAFDVAIEDHANADGYMVSVYKVNDLGDLEATDITNMSFDKTEGVLPAVSAGGSYQGIAADGGTVTYGLTAGITYSIGVTAYNYLDGDGDGTDDGILYGNEVFSNREVLKAVTAANVEILAKTPFVRVTGEEWQQDQNGVAKLMEVTNDTFKTEDVTFGISSNEKISGNWYLDDFDASGAFTDTDSFDVALKGLAEGSHTLNVSGKDADGDSFRRTKVFTVDTKAPKLLLSAPVNGQCFGEDGVLHVEGVTDQDAYFIVAVDGDIRVASAKISDMGALSGRIDTDGIFGFDINVDPRVATHHIRITVTDKAGNSYSSEAGVQNMGLSHIGSLSLYADGVRYTNRNLALSSEGSTVAAMSLVAETEGGGSFVINDPDLVYWEAKAVNGSASIGDDGLLTVQPGSIGYVTGGLQVAQSASMTASATFGAEVYGVPLSDYVTLTLGSTIGGTVTGEGRYRSGETVEITAVPLAGYRFAGWTVQGTARIANINSAQTTITLSGTNVTVTARFERTGGTGTESEADQSPSDMASIRRQAAAGEKVVIALPRDIAEKQPVVCVLRNGREYVVPWSMIKDGNLTFIAPVDGTYYLKEVKTGFTDIKDNWAGEYIEFAAARGLFSGIGGNLFDPGGAMTRAMFVTVLGRLQDVDTAGYSGSSFNDVKEGQWYSKYVEWAFQSGITAGIGSGLFDPDGEITREQMCVIFERYLKFAGYDLPEAVEPEAFADEGEISAWAKNAVEFAQRAGLVNGIGNNLFNPEGNATRAEVAAIFKRVIEKIVESKQGGSE